MDRKTQRVFSSRKQVRQSSRNVSTGGEETREDHEESHFLWRFVIGQEADYRGNKGTPFFERDDLSLPVCVERKRHAVAKSLQNKQNGRDWKRNEHEVILCPRASYSRRFQTRDVSLRRVYEGLWRKINGEFLWIKSKVFFFVIRCWKRNVKIFIFL